MKFSCDKYVLQNAITTAARAASPKSTITVLEGLLIEAAGAGVKITGYDLKKGIFTTVEADVVEQGAAVFTAKLFVEMVRRLPDGIVTVETDGDNARVRCGRSEYTMMTMDAEEYPELMTVAAEQTIKLPQPLLKEMIEETVFAVSANESRPVYMGSLFEISGGELTVVSVDGYRLALRREKLEGFDEESRFIIPGSALSDVERICSDDEKAEAVICVGSKHVSFEIDSITVISRRLEGDFLNYKKAVPESFRTDIAIDRTEFLSVVDRVSLVVDDKMKSPLRVVFGDGRIDFSCASPMGRAVDEYVCDGNGGEVEIGFNDRYLREALRAAPAEQLLCRINTGSSPCVLAPADGGDKFIYMILPVRLSARD